MNKSWHSFDEMPDDVREQVEDAIKAIQAYHGAKKVVWADRRSWAYRRFAWRVWYRRELFHRIGIHTYIPLMERTETGIYQNGSACMFCAPER